MKQIVKKRPDIVFYLKIFPLAMHGPVAMENAKAIVCKHSMELLEESYAGKQLKASCPAPEIARNIKLADSLHITGTPSIVLPDGKVVVGPNPNMLVPLIDQAAKDMKKTTRRETSHKTASHS